MAQLPMDVRLAKILIFGAILHCLDPILTVAASMVAKRTGVLVIFPSALLPVP